ncbi:MAG: hypothetical protein M0R37_12750 [Bacteroidales bacterium]|nr:hypothetical protein [Bacteroidales bacterium]
MKAKSDIEFGKEYRDKNTGFKGKATGVLFYQYGCTRVILDALVEGRVEQATFDEPGLEAVDAPEPFKARARTGGPRTMPTRVGIR